MEIKTILAIQGNSPAIATATVIATLLDLDCQLLNAEDVGNSQSLPPESAILLTENQLRFLAQLRIDGFEGAVLVLAQEPFLTLKKKYPILRSGQGSHDACSVPWMLPDLLTRVVNLVPLAPENLLMLQNKLTFASDWLQQTAIPHLERLRQLNLEWDRELDSLANIVEDLRRLTPDVCHYNAIIEKRGQKQIQQHFLTLLAEMRSTKATNESQIAAFRQAFETWHNFVLQSGEGLGKFS